MAEPRWRVAIIDSGLDRQVGIAPVAVCRFDDAAGCVVEGELAGDGTGHGTAVAQIICAPISPVADPPAVETLIAQVMCDSTGATPASTAAAISESPHLADLPQPRCCARSSRARRGHCRSPACGCGGGGCGPGPARRELPFPARYPGVIRATGDARCAAGEISSIDEPTDLFGSCVAFNASSARTLRGASIGAAHLTRTIVSRISPGMRAADVRAALAGFAAVRRRERRWQSAPLGA